MPETRLKKQYEKFREYFEKRNMTQSLKAMLLVDKYHVGKRRGGGPERTHLYEVAGQVLSFLEGHLNADTLDCVVAAAFMHDLVEDYPKQYSAENLERDFSQRTYRITMSVCKWEGFEKKAEDYEKYFEMVTGDLFAVFVKVSDRIHNLSTCLEGMSDKRILSYIDETEKYFYPMIKSTRKEYEKFYMALTGMKQQLEYRVKMTQMVLDLRNKD